MLHWVLEKISENCKRESQFEIGFYLNKLLQFSLDILQTTDVIPSNVWSLDDSLAKSGRTALSHSKLKKENKVSVNWSMPKL